MAVSVSTGMRNIFATSRASAIDRSWSQRCRHLRTYLEVHKERNGSEAYIET